ncbi:glycosyltransferase family 4 protein [Romboutsia timonensis]|uniref:glycosyltransferase family 4 protein n=1 Tax=Romboutsia timonensis TaxID=1776391 RepID=UPI0008DB114A|nr:glycosyltransferase family 4 protein [Romboutsia timonensis]
MNKKGKIIQVSAIDATMDKLLRRLNELSIEEGYDVIGVCSQGSKTDSLKKEGFNIKNINIDRRISPLSNLKSIYEMYKFLKKEKPDIVHVHTPIAAVLGRIAAKFAKVPNIIYTAHGFYFHENMKPLVYKIFLNIEKFIARWATDFIFTQSEEDAQTALKNKFIDTDKIIAIGNGVDVCGKFNPRNINKDEINDLYKELGLKKGDKIVSFIGRLVKEKGIFDLLDSYKYIRNDVKFLIIGDIAQGDRDIETIEKINRYKENKNIIFTGNRTDIHNLLYISDIFCLPSYREGMPRSIIEAMAIECAVIATNIRGSREEVINGKTGYLVNLNSPKEIANKIDEIFNNESLLNSMKLEGRKRAEQIYDEDVVVRKQLDVFKSLLNIKN